MDKVIELAPFVLKPGVGEAALIEASSALEHNFLERQPGFVGRQLVREAPGRYLDVVWWSSAAAVAAAMAKAEADPAAAAYFALMDLTVAQDQGGAGAPKILDVVHTHWIAERAVA